MKNSDPYSDVVIYPIRYYEWSESYISYKDYIAIPILVFLITLISFVYSSYKYRHDKKLKIYFRLGLMAKLFASIFLGLIFQYVFKEGDTFTYYRGAMSISINFFHDLWETIKILIFDSDYMIEHPEIRTWYFAQGVFTLLRSDAALAVMKFGGLASFLGFRTYLGTSLYFAVFAFIGCWYIFKVFYEMYPFLHRRLALAALYLPSVILWSSGMLKDSLVIGWMGILLYSVYKLFIKREFKIKYILGLIIASHFIIDIKVYVYLTFMPALVIWVISNYISHIRDLALKTVGTPVFVLSFLVITFIAYTQITNIYPQYKLDIAAQKIVFYYEWVEMVERKSIKEGGEKWSNFDLGEIEPTTLGIIKKAPKAINAALFRPYIWEADKLFNMPAAIESLLYLSLSLIVLIRLKFIYFFLNIFRNPDVLFCMTFTVALAFVVGISTPNFGTLMRYKIPMLPFFLIGLFILNSKVKRV